MSSFNLLLYLGDYAAGPDVWSGSSLRGLQVCGGLVETSDGLGVFSSDSTTSIPEVMTFSHENDALAWADVIYVMDNVPSTFLRRAHQSGHILIAENHTPIEHLFYQGLTPAQRRETHLRAIETYSTQLRLAHVLVARSDVEWASLVDGYVLAGRLTPEQIEDDPTLSQVLIKVPIGSSHALELAPPDSGATDTTLDVIWNGGLYEFHDPVYLVEALEPLLVDGIANLHFPFLPTRETRVSRELRNHLQGKSYSARVKLGGPAPESVGRRVFAVVGRPGVENTHCVRLRLRETYENSVPIISDSHGATGALIRVDHLGVALSSELPQARAQLREFHSTGYSVAVESVRLKRQQGEFDRALAQLRRTITRMLSGRSIRN